MFKVYLSGNLGKAFVFSSLDEAKRFSIDNYENFSFMAIKGELLYSTLKRYDFVDCVRYEFGVIERTGALL